MPESISSAFSEPEDFEAALRAEGCLSLLVMAPGQFRARLTQITLNQLDLSAVEEHLPRIAFMSMPADAVTVIFPIGTATAPVCGGLELSEGELMTLSPGTRFHARSNGHSHWGAISLPTDKLFKYGVVLREVGLSVAPSIHRLRPRPSAGRQLRSLFSAAIRTAVRCPRILVDPKAAHGLEQQLLDVLVHCLAEALIYNGTRYDRENRALMVRYEELLRNGQRTKLPVTHISAALQISERRLRHLCAEHLKMGPASYDRLRRMSLARRDLRNGNPSPATVATIARLNGFRDPGRFAIKYRATFGEPPSTTLRQERRHSQRTLRER